MRSLLFVIVVLCSSVQAADPPPQPIPRTERRPDAPQINTPLSATDRLAGKTPTPPPFIIAVWYQPRDTLAVWKARGINTLIGYESQTKTVTLEDWEAAAGLNELFMIRQPRDVPQDDLKNEPYLLAWMLGDEPDIHDREPEPLLTGYQMMKQAAPKLPVFLNVSGGNLLFKKTPRVKYEQYFQAADWIGNDFYPVTGWGQPTWLPKVGQAVDLCREISKGKPQFAFIETANQQLAWVKDARGVTPAEMRCEIWDAVIHGVRGIVYFPQQMSPFKFDAAPSSVSVEMMRQNQLLETLGPALATARDPREMKVSVNPPLEAAWRKTTDGNYYIIVLNLSKESQKAQPLRLTGFPAAAAKDLAAGGKALTVTDNGLVEDFASYGLHIYEIMGKP